MKIIDIQEKTVPISSEIKNAYISFAKMDCSVVAIKTDVKNKSSFLKIALNLEGIPFRCNFKFINAVSEPEKNPESKRSRIRIV